MTPTNPGGSSHNRPPVDLARLLIASCTHNELDWGEEAAVRLVVAHGGWLRRPEFTRHVRTDQRADGVDIAWVDWDSAATEPDHSPASGSQRSILRLACHLAGHLPESPGDDWTLAWILTGLDPTNAVLASRAVAMTALGPDAVGPLR